MEDLEFHKKLINICDDIIKHGHGEIIVEVSEIKNQFRTKIIIKAGRSWVFFKEKEFRNIDNDNII